MLFQTACPDIVIPIGGLTSNIILGYGVYDDSKSFTLYGPLSYDLLDFTIEVSNDPQATDSSDWYTLNNGVADIGPPLGAKASVFPFLSFAAFRIRASGGVSNDTTWKMTKQWEV